LLPEMVVRVTPLNPIWICPWDWPLCH
jgi:hypothetical protein